MIRSLTINFLLVSMLSVMTAAPSTGQSRQEMPIGGQTISLSGIWRFKLDPLNEGIQSRGVKPAVLFPSVILLPGSTDQAGYGYRAQGMTSLRLTRLYAYAGAAWYEKSVYVPAAWKGKEVYLYLERAHWQTEAWINGHAAGRRQSLSVPHVYDITSFIRPGEENKIRIRVDNSIIYHIGSPHAISEETQTDWNGIIGKMRLEAFDKVHIEDLQVYPDIKNKEASVRVSVRNETGAPVKGRVLLTVQPEDDKDSGTIRRAEVSFRGTDSVLTVTTKVSFGNDMRLWDEFHPSLYLLKATLNASGGYGDADTTVFGMREFSTKGTQFFINGRPAFIRSDVNSAESPITGYPAMDLSEWMHVFRVCKAYGLNAMRFHSWCPPEAAFEAADRLGFYLQVENSDWRFNIGKDTAASGFLAREADRILRTYGNHPSFTMFCEGNELVGPRRDSFLTTLIHHWEKEDPRHLYTGSSGYPVLKANEYEDLYGPRAQHWKEGLAGRLNKSPYHTDFDYSTTVARYPVPVVSHEVGQWCVYPGYGQIAKYTGVLKPYNYALFRESLRQHHMLDEAQSFTMASGKFQVIQKKEELEALLRTPALGGYELLQLEDYPGQGTAPVGVVDAFWDPKPYVAAKEFREFNGPEVLLLSAPSFIFTSDQPFKATALLANYGEMALKNAIVHWSLSFKDGTVYRQGNFDKKDIALGGPQTLGKLSIPLDGIRKASRLTLVLSLEGSGVTNHWDIWVYPPKLPAVKDAAPFLIARDWNAKVIETLQRGGRVLLLADTARLVPRLSPSFSGISWNTVWSGTPPDKLGILCDPGDAAFKYFPTEYYSDWQWWDLVRHSRPLLMNHMPPALRPLVQMIPDWNKNNRIGLVLEARVGKGKLLMTGIDLTDDMDHRPVARQMLYSLERYVGSNAFDPQTEVPEKDIAWLFKQP